MFSVKVGQGGERSRGGSPYGYTLAAFVTVGLSLYMLANGTDSVALRPFILATMPLGAISVVCLQFFPLGFVPTGFMWFAAWTLFAIPGGIQL